MKTKTRLNLSFGGQILFAAILGMYVLLGLNDVKQQFSFVVEHDAIVIANARHLSMLVVDMETGQRGFCIVQKEEFLAPYIDGVKKFDVLIEKEKKLVSDNPGQVEALERIEHLVREWQEKAAKPEIEMARRVATHTIDAQQLQDVLRLGVGKELIDRFMTLSHEIEVFFSDRGDWEGAFVVEIIRKCMAHREDSQRGFLITGKDVFLETYIDGGQKELPENFARLRAIVSERGRDDELLKKIDRLEQLTYEWAEKAAEPEIAARREMNENPESLKNVAALLEASTGKVLIDEISSSSR
jgi:methyl-accepting chemotaxis protein